jgi:hypothetical protein
MDLPDFFVNKAGRLRAFWRLAAFTLAYLCVVSGLFLAVRIGLALLLPKGAGRVLAESGWGFVVQSVLLFAAAALVGWFASLVLEELPWRALGWALHRGWAPDLLKGLLVGAVSVGLTAALGAALGSYRFSPGGAGGAGAVARTLIFSCVVFLLGAAAEEMLFRGYPLQTILRAWPFRVALVPTSVVFALVHMGNPNVAPAFTLVNTFLAGVLLVVAYWRTRSLWFPFGWHWGWNYAQGALLGSPVSGITNITPHPALAFSDTGPAWLGGGAYGIEGGALCTLALALTTAYVWRTRLLSASPEMRAYTDGENPDDTPAGAGLLGLQ